MDDKLTLYIQELEYNTKIIHNKIDLLVNDNTKPYVEFGNELSKLLDEKIGNEMKIKLLIKMIKE